MVVGVGAGLATNRRSTLNGIFPGGLAAVGVLSRQAALSDNSGHSQWVAPRLSASKCRSDCVCRSYSDSDVIRG